MTSDRRVALVTGASRGVGRATPCRWPKSVSMSRSPRAPSARAGVRRAPRRQPDVRCPGSVESTAELVRAEGREALAVGLDLTDPLSIGLAVGRILEQWGHVDVLVNNAIYTGRGPRPPCSTSRWPILRDEIDIDIVAPLTLISLLVPAMVERGEGTVLNVTSGVAYTDPLDMGSYGVGYAVGKAGLFKVCRHPGRRAGRAGPTRLQRASRLHPHRADGSCTWPTRKASI